MHNKKKQLISKPKDAASMIILKKIKKKTYVLMGRRPKSSKFMPNVYVFPGGALEKQDFLANKYFNFKLQSQRKKLKARDENHACAIFFTAIRETYEETGLYLSTKVKKKINLSSFNGIYSENYYKYSLLPDLNKLTFFGRAITPSLFKKRFHARFFVSFINNFHGNIKTNGELEDLEWINILDVKKKNIADVTEFMIEQLIKLNGNFTVFDKEFSYPMFTWKNRKVWVKWEVL